MQQHGQRFLRTAHDGSAPVRPRATTSFPLSALCSRPLAMKAAFAGFAGLIAACVAAPANMELRQPASELAGRSAGPPRRCVAIESNVALTVASRDSHMLLYGRGRTIWANDLGPSCGLATNATLIVQPIGASYCRGDLVRSIDPVSGVRGPACFLGDFIPFTR